MVKDVPEWANWFAIDGDGWSWWFEKTPAWDEVRKVWSVSEGEHLRYEKRLPAGDCESLFSAIAADPTRAMPASATAAAAILRVAADLVEGARAEDYGEFTDNVDFMAERAGVTREQACNLLIALKAARLRFNPSHHDSMVDKVAYTALGVVAMSG